MSNSVEFIHPDYQLHEHQVTLCNQIYRGIDTAKDLLIQLPNEDNDLFLNRVNEATLDNFVERITKAMSGQVLRKELVLEDMSDAMIDDADDISGNDSIDQFARTITDMAIRDGKSYVLVDAPMEGGDPYFSAIGRSQVINWRKTDDGIYTLVVILESYAMEDGFEIEYYPQYRVIDAVGNVQIWRAAKKGGAFEIVEEIMTSYNFCPFYEFDVDDAPILYDIAKINAKHMNFTSLRDRYLRDALDPILFGKALGIDSKGSEENPTVVIGINQMMNTDNPDASLEWVEMSGNNFTISEELLVKLEQDMGERALSVQADSNVKTATQVESDNAEGNARLNDIADDLENIMNLAMNAYSLIKYSKEMVGDIKVVRDFNRVNVDATALTAINTLKVSGTISAKTALESINESDLITIDNVEDEIAAIEEEMMGMQEEVILEEE